LAPKETFFASFEKFVQLEDGKKLAGYGALLEMLVQLVHQSLHLHSMGEFVDLHSEGDALEVLHLAVQKARNQNYTARVEIVALYTLNYALFSFLTS
jgi:hypothetical protein